MDYVFIFMCLIGGCVAIDAVLDVNVVNTSAYSYINYTYSGIRIYIGTPNNGIRTTSVLWNGTSLWDKSSVRKLFLSYIRMTDITGRCVNYHIIVLKGTDKKETSLIYEEDIINQAVYNVTLDNFFSCVVPLPKKIKLNYHHYHTMNYF